MKILYGIQGTGNGHISRAEDIVPHLKKMGDVDILVSGNQSQVNAQFEINYQRMGLTFLSSKSGKVDLLKTVMNANPIRFIKEIRDFPIAKYDLVISDFEPVSAWAALTRNVPCIELSHQAAVAHTDSPKPDGNFTIGNYILNHYCPTKKKYGFHFESFAETVFTPLIRKSIREIETRNESYYTVYLPAYHDDVIAKVLKIFNIEWHVFSKYAKKTYTVENITFYPIDGEKFTESLATCSGVLCGAGFELPAEALFLGKKLLVIPMIGQYEQLCNAASLKKLGVTVLNELSLVHYRTINNWISITKPIQITYQDQTEQIIDTIMQDFESNTIPKIEISRPLLNPQFYKLFL